MQPLNLPPSELKIRSMKGKNEVFDAIRKKYVALTPEEWVRQHFIGYLVREKNVPASLIAVETSLKYNGLQKRSDIVIYNNLGKPRMIVECKAPEIKITQDVFDQVAIYNMTLNVPCLVVTNGMEHFACHIDQRNQTYEFLRDIPDFREMNQF
jgi:type I site-specific restriction endonuclease